MKRAFVATITGLLVLVSAGGAVAAWSASGVGTGQATAGVLATPGAPTAARQDPATTVALSWPSLASATSYDVHRFATSSATTGGTAVCAAVATTSCSDTSAPTTDVWYRVTARRNAWSSPTGAPGAAAEVVTAGMHVGDLDDVSLRPSGGSWTARVEVLVLDQSGLPVSEATVSFTWSATKGTDTVDGASSCKTATTGRCTASALSLQNGYSPNTFTVVDVSHGSLVYLPSSNTDPDGPPQDSTGTTITISK